MEILSPVIKNITYVFSKCREREREREGYKFFMTKKN